MYKRLLYQCEIEKDDKAQHYAVVAEDLEIVAADIGHKELDSQNRNDECDDRADGEDNKLLSREGVAFR